MYGGGYSVCITMYIYSTYYVQKLKKPNDNNKVINSIFGNSFPYLLINLFIYLFSYFLSYLLLIY